MKCGVLWNTSQEWVTETCTNVDEPPKAFIRTKGDRHQSAHIDSICIQFWEMQTYPLWQKVDQCLPGHSVGVGNARQKGTKMEVLRIFDRGGSCTGVYTC